VIRSGYNDLSKYKCWKLFQAISNESDEWNLVAVKGKVMTVKEPVTVGERKLKLAVVVVEVLPWIFGKQ